MPKISHEVTIVFDIFPCYYCGVTIYKIYVQAGFGLSLANLYYFLNEFCRFITKGCLLISI
jgi:hypothetical protein